MAQAIGTVKTLTGKFFAKESSGDVIELKIGDEITQGMIVFGGDENSATSKIDIQIISNDNIMTLSGTQSQLFDISMIEQQGHTEEIGISTDSINAALDSNMHNQNMQNNQNSHDSLLAESAQGVEKTHEADGNQHFDARTGNVVDVNSNLHSAKFVSSDIDVNSRFDARTGDMTDINSDLRDATFKNPDFIHHPKSIVQHTEILIDDVTRNEDQETMTFTVRLTAPIGTDVSFDYTTASDTATSGLDFTPTSGTAIIPAGSSTFIITVPITDDVIVENSEQFFINLTNPSSNLTIIDNQGIGTILDTGGEPNLDSVTIKLISTDINGNEIAPATIAEGDTAYYKAILIDPSGNPITTATGNVDITFSDKTAVRTGTTTDGELDFTGTNQTVALNTVFTAAANDDYLSDNGEKFNVQITDNTYSNAAAYENVITDTTPVITTITDDTGTPNTPNDGPETTHESVIIKLIAADASGNAITDGSGNYVLAQDVKEGDSGHYIALAFQPNSTPSPSTIITSNGTVQVSFTDSSATGANTQTTIDGTQDYDNSVQTVTIGTAFSTATFDDYIADNGETFNVSIDNGTYIPPTPTTGYENVHIDTTPVITTITDGANDSTPNENVDTVYVQLTTNDTVKEQDGGILTHELHLVDKDGNAVNLATGETIEVTLAYNPDTTEAADFSTKTTTVTITGDGGSNYSFNNTIVDDFLNEGDESYTVKIASISNKGTYFENVEIDTSNNSATGTITDAKTGNDEIPNQDVDTVYASIIGPANVNEGDTTTIYTVQLLDKDGNPVTVTNNTDVTVKYENILTQDGDTQYNNNDNITVTINASGSTGTFTVDTISDYMADNNEDYKLTITNVNTTEFENINISGYTDTNGTLHVDTITTTITDDTGTPNTPNDGPETTHESVIIKLIAADASGNAITDGSGNYVLAQDVKEGDSGHYIALAFQPNSTPSPSTIITSNGTVQVSFTDSSATGANTQTTIDGTQDYDNSVQTVTIGTAFSTATFDDYIADNGETFNVSIDNGTYIPPTPTTGYENVHIDTTPVITTITDDTGTPNTPNDGNEPNHEAVQIQLVSADTNGDPIVDGSGNYVLTQNVNEGNSGHYIALAFAPNTTPSPATQITSNGTVTVSFSDNTATGAASQTTIDGTQDYDNNSQTITIGQAFTTATYDDYMSDNAETFNVFINNGSYAPTSGGYENVSIDTTPVVTTITDDTGTPTNLTDGPEPTHETARVVLVATDAAGTISATNGVLNIIDTNSVAEGHDFYYKAVAIDADGKVLTNQSGNVDVSFVDNSATSGAGDASDDYTHTTTNIVIGTVFSAKAIDDFTSDTSEKFTVKISNPTLSDYENVEVDSGHDIVTSTITDDISFGRPDNAYVDEDNFDITDANSHLQGGKLDYGGVADADGNSSSGAPTLFNITTTAGKDDYSLAFDSSVAPSLTSGGVVVDYDFSTAGTVIGYLHGGDSTNDKVFDVILDKHNAGGSDDGYTYTQYKNIDHPLVNADDTVTLTFGYQITDDGTTSHTENFNVVVNDSMPKAGSQSLITNEDSSLPIVISDESFASGSINLDNGVDGATDVASGSTINIYDVGKDDIVGILLNNGDGTLTFTPTHNYSGSTNGFTYSVSDTDGDTATGSVGLSVTPIADAPSIIVENINTTEDNDNTQEGANSVALKLHTPVLSNDQLDINNQHGSDSSDHAERLGYVTISFNAGVDGAIIEKADGTDLFTIGANTQPMKIYITPDGNENTDYHYTGLDQNATGVIKLTQTEYDNLHIIPSEDNAKNINLTISITSYEVNDSGVPLDINSATLSETTTAMEVVDVQAVTDDITLLYNQQGTEGGSDNTDYTHVSGDEGAIRTIDLGALLDATSGDLDGSEHRSYTISGIPEGTIISVSGVQTAVAAGQTSATVDFPDNTVANPTFTMTLPDQYSGTVNATITLKAVDTDSDSTGTIAEKTASVTFDITVNPVADTVTLQVAQAFGDEDAGRLTGNTAKDSNAATINDAANGIDLDIKVTSEDTDGSETYTVTIKDIPDGGELYYNGILISKDTASGSGLMITDVGMDSNGGSAWKVQIDDFDNNAPLKFIPPHNSDNDYNFTVDSYSVDSGGHNSSANTQSLIMNIQVDGVADIPIHDNLATVQVADENGDNKTFNATATEGSTVALKDVLSDAANLSSYDTDGSETLSIKIIGLESGFDIVGNGATLISGSGSSRVWFVDLAHFQNGDVQLSSPTNYAGEIDFKMAMVTTETEGDSKTHPTQDISVMITPIADTATVNSSDTQNEDQTKTLDFTFASPDTDGASGGEEMLKSFSIDMDTVDNNIILTGSNSGVLNSFGVVNLSVANGVLETVTATLPEDSNMNGGYNFNISYTYEDIAKDAAGNTYVDTKIVSNKNYVVTVTAVTDGIDMSTTTTTTTGDNSVDADGSTVHVIDSGAFTKTISIAGIDSDGRGHLDYDGSEQFTRITVSGVPEGIAVGGSDGTYAGDTGAGNYSGFWYVNIPNETIDGSTTYDLAFDVNGNLNQSDVPYSVTITAFSEDAGNGVEQSDNQSFDLYIDQHIGGTGGTPAVITQFYQDIDQDGIHDHDYEVSTVSDTNITDGDAYTNSVLREDTAFLLSEVVHVATDDASSDFSITLKNIPNGVTVEGMTYNAQGDFYTISGNGNQQAVVDMLQSIKITPASNANTNANNISGSDLDFDISLTTYAGDSSHNALINFSGSVLPITDAMDLTTVNDGTTNEDVVQDFSITLDNSADRANTTIVDGKTYVHLSENYTDIQGSDGANGTLKLDGNIILATSVSGVSGIPDGDYYVISGVSYNDTLNFTFTPAINRNGSVTVDTYVKNIEAEDWNPYNTTEMISHSTTSFDVLAARDGYTFDATTNPSVGDEDTMVQVSVAVSDPDSSELLTSVSLDKIPNGFLVYYGGDEGSAVMAQNIGVNGTMTMQMTYGVDETVDYNLWNIPLDNGVMPAYIGIKAPQNWSGVIPNVEFHAVDDSGDVNTNPFDITFTPVVDDITINPTQTFGDAGDDIALKLNANAVDLDGSETVTVTLHGLGTGASFKTDGAETIATYDSGTDTYTINDISAIHINDVTFTQSPMSGSIHVTAQMFEHGIAAGSAIVSDNFDVKINTVIPTNGDDTLLYSGNDIDALGGVDTIILKADGILDFTKLHNVEVIDLAPNGTHTISNLTLTDVLNITDFNHTLTINGDSTDDVTTVDKTGWSETSQSSAAGVTTHVYNNDTTSDSITLKVEDQIDHTGL